eukprot:1022023-Pelagomonas_calceolata.AAC.1
MLVENVSPTNQPESQAVGQPLVTPEQNSVYDSSADLRYRLQGVWREAELLDPRENNNKLATYQAIC